ncbi:TPA: hypothetical protein ACKQB7_000017 [Serratia marcescens]
MTTNTVLANEWIFSGDENAISDGVLKISVQAGSYEILFPSTANPNSGAVPINGEILYGNRYFGFDGEQADRMIARLLKVKCSG